MNNKFSSFLSILTILISVGCKSQNFIVLNGYLCPEANDQIDTFLIEKKFFGENMELIEEINYSFQEDKLNSVKKKFDKTGKLFYKESYLLDSTYITLVEFKRNEKGDIEKQIITNKGQKNTLVHINEYNQNGKLFKFTIVTEDLKERIGKMPNTYSIYSYDLNGNMINLKQYMDDSLTLNDSYKYDNLGNKVEELSELSPDGSIYKSTFQFNKFGKIIKQENYVDNIKVSIADMSWNDKLPKETIIRYLNDNYTEKILYKKE